MPGNPSSESRYGATPEEWIGLARRFPNRLQTVVSNPRATISPTSSLTSLGKVPSRYDRVRKVVGIPDWPRRPLTRNRIRAAMREPDYGICVILGRGLAAFDVDLEDEDLANRIETIAYRQEIRGACVRFRENSPRRLILFRVAERLGKFSLRPDRGDTGMVEILGDGQQFVAAGTHPSGCRYQWRKIREW